MSDHGLFGAVTSTKCSTFGDDLGTGAFNDGEEFLLFLVGDLEAVEGGFEVAEGSVEFRIANVHAGVGGFHLLAVIMGGSAGGEGEELDQMFFEAGQIWVGRLPHDGFGARAVK